jgi:hypothetical protein
MGCVSEASIRLGVIEMDMRNGCMNKSMLHFKKKGSNYSQARGYVHDLEGFTLEEVKFISNFEKYWKYI